MLRWIIAGLGVLSVAVASPVLAAANGQPKRTCSVSVVSRSAGIAVLSGNPPQNGSEVAAGIVDGTVCGKPFHGAIRDIAHFPMLGNVNGTGTVFGPAGSITFRFNETATINQNHSATLHGPATLTGGSGLYRRAAGSGSLSGAQSANSPVTTQHLTGTLTY